jgi:hypothetical protein
VYQQAASIETQGNPEAEHNQVQTSKPQPNRSLSSYFIAVPGSIVPSHSSLHHPTATSALHPLVASRQPLLTKTIPVTFLYQPLRHSSPSFPNQSPHHDGSDEEQPVAIASNRRPPNNPPLFPFHATTHATRHPSNQIHRILPSTAQHPSPLYHPPYHPQTRLVCFERVENHRHWRIRSLLPLACILLPLCQPSPSTHPLTTSGTSEPSSQPIRFTSSRIHRPALDLTTNAKKKTCFSSRFGKKIDVSRV